MSRPQTVLLPFAALLALSLAGLTLAQDSGDTPPEKDAAKKPAEEEDKHANPLDDPKMQQSAKLGRLLAKKRCVICHKVEGKGGILSPPIEEVTALRFEKMREYSKFVAELKAKDPARYNAGKKTFEKIEAEENRYKKLMLWLEAYLKRPTFDNAQAKMTKQPLKDHEIDQLIAYLLTLEPK